MTNFLLCCSSPSGFGANTVIKHTEIYFSTQKYISLCNKAMICLQIKRHKKKNARAAYRYIAIFKKH
jgi:hypothetical protein